ncbi:MAG: hypothetical protein WBA93_32470 [Microcoleaceae cyanobacterium]
MMSEFPKQLELFELPKLPDSRFYLSKIDENSRVWLTRKMELSPYFTEAKSYKIKGIKSAIYQLRHKYKELQLLEKQDKQWLLHFRVKPPTIWKPGIWERQPIQITCNIMSG